MNFLSIIDKGYSSNQSQAYPCGQTLPDELIEMIIARIQFPAILKARCLSRGWRLRLSTEPELAMVKTFQRQVSSVSGSWPTFCPAFALDETIIGYNRITHSWARMKMHSLLYQYSCNFPYTSPLYPVTDHHFTYYALDNRIKELDSGQPTTIFGGALLCNIYRSGNEQQPDSFNRYQVFVANVITGNYKFLPLSPPYQPPAAAAIGCKRGEHRLFQAGTDHNTSYKVLLANVCECLTRNDDDSPSLIMAYCLGIQYYDSQTAIWLDRYTFLSTFSIFPSPRDIIDVHLDACSPLFNSCIYILLFALKTFEDEDYIVEENFHNYPHDLICVEYNIGTGQIREFDIDIGESLLVAYINHKLQRATNFALDEIVGSSIHVCCSRIILLLAVLEMDDHKNYNLKVYVYSYNPDLQEEERLELEAVGPPVPETILFSELFPMRAHGTTKFSSDENNLYICFRISVSKTVIYSYHVSDERWSIVPCPRELLENFDRCKITSLSTFAPGWRTFEL